MPICANPGQVIVDPDTGCLDGKGVKGNDAFAHGPVGSPRRPLCPWEGRLLKASLEGTSVLQPLIESQLRLALRSTREKRGCSKASGVATPGTGARLERSLGAAVPRGPVQIPWQVQRFRKVYKSQVRKQ